MWSIRQDVDKDIWEVETDGDWLLECWWLPWKYVNFSTTVSFFSQPINQQIFVGFLHHELDLLSTLKRRWDCVNSWVKQGIRMEIMKGRETSSSRAVVSISLIFITANFEQYCFTTWSVFLPFFLPIKILLIPQVLMHAPSLRKPSLTLWPLLFAVCVAYSTVTSVISALILGDANRC